MDGVVALSCAVAQPRRLRRRAGHLPPFDTDTLSSRRLAAPRSTSSPRCLPRPPSPRRCSLRSSGLAPTSSTTVSDFGCGSGVGVRSRADAASLLSDHRFRCLTTSSTPSPPQTAALASTPSPSPTFRARTLSARSSSSPPRRSTRPSARSRSASASSRPRATRLPSTPLRRHGRSLLSRTPSSPRTACRFRP